MGLLQPGDEVILLEPYYGYHLSTIMAVKAVLLIVSLQEPEWFWAMEALKKAITDRIKAIVVNTPSNPSGKVFATQELKGIAAVARRQDGRRFRFGL